MALYFLNELLVKLSGLLQLPYLFLFFQHSSKLERDRESARV
jgi:hypothetical protein